MMSAGTTKAINQFLADSANDPGSTHKEIKFNDTLVCIPICVGYPEALTGAQLSKTIRYYQRATHVKEICIYLSPYTDPFCDPEKLQEAREFAIQEWIKNQPILSFEENTVKVSKQWKNSKVTVILQDDLEKNNQYIEIKQSVDELVKTTENIQKLTEEAAEDFLDRKIKQNKTKEEKTSDEQYGILKKRAIEHLAQEIAYFCYCVLTKTQHDEEKLLDPSQLMDRVVIHYNNKLYRAMLEAATLIGTQGKFVKKATVIQALQVKKSNNQLGEYKFDYLLNTKECYSKNNESVNNHPIKEVVMDEKEAQLAKEAAVFYTHIPPELRGPTAAEFFAVVYCKVHQGQALEYKSVKESADTNFLLTRQC